MAKRRRVGNLLALAVLSTVIQRPMHPYEMASVLRERGKDQDMKIKWGSLYTVVANLEKHGLVAATESVKQGGQPERTVYEITDAGREELKDWVRELLGTPEREQPLLATGLSVMTALPPVEATELLRQRLTVLTSQLDTDRAVLTEAGREIPRLFLIESEYDLALRTAEIAWLSTLVDELTDGTFPGLAAWQAYHDTGELPADLAELAERGSTTE